MKDPTNNELKYSLFQLFLMQFSLTLPLIMMNAPLWLIIAIPILIIYLPWKTQSLSLHIILFSLYDIVRPILYVWGIIVTAQGEQDFFAIAFYIIAGLQAFSIIKRLIGTICAIILVFINDERSDV